MLDSESKRDVQKTLSMNAAPHVIIIAFILILAGCSGRRTNDTAELEAEISAVVWAKVGNANRVYLDFRRLAPFAWQRLFVFPPYTAREDIYSSLGFHWDGVEQLSIEDRDSNTLLVFVQDRTVTRYLEHPRVQGDFSMLQAGHGYTPDEAYFEVVEAGLFDPWFVVAEASRGR